MFQVISVAWRENGEIKLRCYASQLQFGWGERKTPAYQIEDYVANAKKAVSEG